MKRRVEAVYRAMKENLNTKMIEFQDELKNKPLSEWNIKPLPGKGEDVEQLILDLLATEKASDVDHILSNWPPAIDSFIHEEMTQRKPESLKVTLLE